MMIEQHKRRPYIDNLRNGPCTKAMFDGWAAQATITAEQCNRGDEYDYRRMAHAAAQEALALALAFILDNDGEYQRVCEERDRYRDQILNTAMLTPPSMFIVNADQTNLT